LHGFSVFNIFRWLKENDQKALRIELKTNEGFLPIKVDRSTNSVARVTCRSSDCAAPKCKLARRSSEKELNARKSNQRHGFWTWAARFHHEEAFFSRKESSSIKTRIHVQFNSLGFSLKFLGLRLVFFSFLFLLANSEEEAEFQCGFSCKIFVETTQ